MPIVELYRSLLVWTANARLAVLDLDEAVASGHIRCMRRHMTDGSRELVPISLWEHHSFTVQGNCFVELGGDILKPVLNSALYLWRPDVRAQWPHLFEDEQPRQPIGSRLLSAEQIVDAQAYYERLLTEDQHRWHGQAVAARHVAVTYLGFDEGSAQTIEDWVIIPVLDRLGLRLRKPREK
jgi:hypothetical protein